MSVPEGCLLVLPSPFQSIGVAGTTPLGSHLYTAATGLRAVRVMREGLTDSRGSARYSRVAFPSPEILCPLRAAGYPLRRFRARGIFRRSPLGQLYITTHPSKSQAFFLKKSKKYLCIFGKKYLLFMHYNISVKNCHQIVTAKFRPLD